MATTGDRYERDEELCPIVEFAKNGFWEQRRRRLERCEYMGRIKDNQNKVASRIYQ
jgi:hypothetical protein